MDLKRQMMQSFWQGIVRLVILHQAARRPVYGGELSRQMRRHGYDISPGSLYPILHAMERAGFLASSIKIFKGRARKYYKLTPSGLICLKEVLQSLPPFIKEILADIPPGASHVKAGNDSGILSDTLPTASLSTCRESHKKLTSNQQS
jgi:DNA-binding PadR family transcriptional regulator